MKANKRGFTLIEILIALAIFAVVAAIASKGLAIAIKNNERLNENFKELSELQRAFILIKRDINQAIARPIRKVDGNLVPAFFAPKLTYFEFTHAGFINPGDIELRSTLERVAYSLNDKQQLVRINWRVLDRVDTTKPEERVLLNNVEQLNISYLDINKKWQTQWAPTNRNAWNAPILTLLPRAVLLHITLTDKTKINWTLRIPGAGFVKLPT